MVPLCLQLLIAAAFLCCFSSTLTRAGPTAQRLCMSTEVTESVNSNSSIVGVISKVSEYGELNMINCPNKNKCFECVGETRGLMNYASTCATEIETSDDRMICSEALEPCNSISDTKCRPNYLAITSLTQCRFEVAVDYQIEHGGYQVYCNDTCITAVYTTEDDSFFMCKGCTKDCLRWLNANKDRNPSIKTKLCLQTEVCQFDGMKTDVASDQASSGSHVRPSYVASVLAAGIFAGLAFLPDPGILTENKFNLWGFSCIGTYK